MGHGNKALSVYLEVEQDILYLISLFILLKCIIFPCVKGGFVSKITVTLWENEMVSTLRLFWWCED